MDSPVPFDSDRWNHIIMPYWALVSVDLRTLARSWVVRIWLILSALVSLVIIISAPAEGSPASQVVTNTLSLYVLVWSTVIIVIGTGAVSSERGIIADAILSKSVTRYHYISAKLTSRLMTTLGIFLLVALPTIYMISRLATNDLHWNGLALGITSVAAIILFLTILGVSLSILVSNTLLATILLWILWYAFGGILSFLDIPYLSPLAIITDLPRILQGVYILSDQIRILWSFGGSALAVAILTAVYFSYRDL